MNQVTKTIVLIHGLWMTPRSWNLFHEYYQMRGYRVFAPAWPRLDGEVEDIRRNPSALEGPGITEVADHYENFVRSLDEPPILIGHSFGGLIVQILLDRGLGTTGVAIDSATPKGIWKLPFSAIASVSPVLLNPWNYKRTVALTFEQFTYSFAHTMPETEARSAYQQNAIPGPGRPIFQVASANFNPWAATKVNYRNPHRSPLLLIGGAEDRLVPAVQNRINYQKYAGSKAITDYKEFPNRSHLIIAQEGWQEVADFALSWAQHNALNATHTQTQAPPKDRMSSL
ncbi:MAG: alpha/beta hydrolase [Pseudanabaena frigida]|uniref:Alpha/beta hydrolase n=1 Tax=Pseudanabaena frigida TaxID=945775 RepID=A0A2W4VWN6_9CYAN|nr:MAG: alpha/beta hydrolase [Pseudanabaena frigida]